MPVQISIERMRFNNAPYIAARVEAAAQPDQGSLRTALNYLYMDQGPINLPRDRLKASRPYLDAAERIVVQWLQTRTNGSERKNYGAPALLAARLSRYSCQECGYADVRALNLDHVEGRIVAASFACLCANCHTIKSRAKDWSGAARQSAVVQAWYHGTEGPPFAAFNTPETFLTPAVEDAEGYAGEFGSVAEIMLKDGPVKRLFDEFDHLEPVIAEARAEGYRYLEFPNAQEGSYYRVSLHPQEDLSPRWLRHGPGQPPGQWVFVPHSAEDGI